MENKKKMTKREMFEQIKANYPLTDEEVAFVDHELELLAKKNSADKKPTTQQKANENLKTTILDFLKNGGKYTISELIKSIPECNELSTSKVSAVVKQMILSGTVERVEEKRKAYFKAV